MPESKTECDSDLLESSKATYDNASGMMEDELLGRAEIKMGSLQQEVKIGMQLHSKTYFLPSPPPNGHKAGSVVYDSVKQTAPQYTRKLEEVKFIEVVWLHVQKVI